jgi:uncharacterized repeat protein (TIGR02543 family)
LIFCTAFGSNKGENKMKHFVIIIFMVIIGFTASACRGDDPLQTKTFTVTFNSNGGSNVNPQIVTENSVVTVPSLPTKTGYDCIFEGWFDENLTTPFVFTTPITVDITLYAKWRPYELGETGPGGGKIFFRDEAGFTLLIPREPGEVPSSTGAFTYAVNKSTAFYLEAASADMDIAFKLMDRYSETDYYWCDNYLGNGLINTIVLANLSSPSPAAKACIEYNYGGKTDWFLPSRDELNLLYINRAFIGNLKNTTDSYYWSSSASWAGMGNEEWCQNFSNGHPSSIQSVTLECLVRAIRAF